jgi:hypothetical protein
LPDLDYKSFYEEVRAKLIFCFLHHSIEAKIKSLKNAQVILASLAQGAAKGQVKYCFFTMRAQHTSVVIALELIFFSSENVSHIKSIDQQESREYP